MLLLDEDPVICAKNTPKSLYYYILSSIHYAYTEIKNINQTHKRRTIGNTKIKPLCELIKDDFLYSKKNRDWLVRFYTTLNVYSKRYCDIEHPAIDNDIIPHTNADRYIVEKFQLHSPLCDIKYEDLLKEHGDVYRTIENIIDLSRLMLIQMEPTADEFPAGEPEWMAELNYEEYSVFDPIKKLFIKIVRNPDGYRYFTSYISDNWHEIRNVPQEMDTIIDFFISSRSC